MIDSGASASFIDASLVRKTGLLSQPSSEATNFRLANNSIQSSAMSSTVFMQIAGTHHEEFITLRHLEPSAHPVILGMNWLKRHNPAFHHRDNLMVITCLFRDCTPTSVISASKIPIVHPYDNDLIAPCAAAIIEPPVSTNPDRQQTICNRSHLHNPNHVDVCDPHSHNSSPSTIQSSVINKIKSTPIDNYSSDLRIISVMDNTFKNTYQNQNIIRYC
ncbi:hypothetical protein INT47_007742 [Mucor saturninus]|uniref:Uncharacterized protein n=1 Tax=Mucor saturninus TaxID=64648 RepID=A0A8H7UPG5_9FUNG|nr:hypothetical protein INT47_007742 [Mucor saturninus]